MCFLLSKSSKKKNNNCIDVTEAWTVDFYRGFIKLRYGYNEYYKK